MKKNWLFSIVLIVIIFSIATITLCFASDVVIKDVPVGAEEGVKIGSAIAVERFLRDRDVKVNDAIQKQFEIDVDNFRNTNGLLRKYSK